MISKTLRSSFYYCSHFSEVEVRHSKVRSFAQWSYNFKRQKWDMYPGSVTLITVNVTFVTTTLFCLSGGWWLW